MTSEDKKFLSNYLKNELQHVDDLWKQETFSHAYIIGYLIGMVKGVIHELDKDENMKIPKKWSVEEFIEWVDELDNIGNK